MMTGGAGGEKGYCLGLLGRSLMIMLTTIASWNGQECHQNCGEKGKLVGECVPETPGSMELNWYFSCRTGAQEPVGELCLGSNGTSRCPTLDMIGKNSEEQPRSQSQNHGDSKSKLWVRELSAGGS